MTTWADLRALMMANKHDHALKAVGNVRFLMLEGQLARAVAARQDAERRFHEYVCSENDELNRVRAENRRLRTENEAMTRALMLVAPENRPAEPVVRRQRGKLRTLSPAAQPPSS